MIGLIDGMKLRWHLDLAGHPVTHAWVLNLYRAGERYPDTVDDYFPHAHAPTPDLARRMRRHQGEERVHARLYARAIEGLGQPVVELTGYDVFNEVIRRHTPASFAVAEGEGGDAARLKVAHFLAHAHHLERRVMRSLEYHLEACARLRADGPAAAVSRVHADEVEHVRYSGEACGELLTRAERDAVFALHARAEAAADRAFSIHQVRDFLRRHGALVPRTHRLLYAACNLMREMSHA